MCLFCNDDERQAEYVDDRCPTCGAQDWCDCPQGDDEWLDDADDDVLEDDEDEDGFLA